MANPVSQLLKSSPRWPMALGRMMLGVMWLATLRWKLPPDFEPPAGTEGLRGWLAREVENPAFGFYGDLIDSVVLPNFTLFAWLIFLAELAVGLALLFGIAVRPAALGGFLMSLNLWLGLKNIEWHWTYVLMMVWHLAVLLSPASTTWSLTRFFPGLQRGFAVFGERLVPNAGNSRGSIAVAILRIGLGVVTLATWWGNIDKDFYDGANFPGFFDWVAKPVEEGGNGASLGFVHSLIDSTILQAPELFGWVMTFLELFIALGLLFGIFTRAASLAAVAFFGSLFLVYFGGEEWIFIYIMLTAAAAVVFVNWGGRKLGVDEFVAKSRGDSPGHLVW